MIDPYNSARRGRTEAAGGGAIADQD